MKNTILILSIILAACVLSACNKDDDTSNNQNIDNCEVDFEPLFSNADAIYISPAFANNNTINPYLLSPVTSAGLLPIGFGSIMPTGASDCRIEGNKQIWEGSYLDTYTYQEVEYLTQQTNVRAIARSGSIVDSQIDFWEMNDHSSGYSRTEDLILEQREEISWERTDGNISIEDRVFENDILVHTIFATYNADGSGTWQQIDDNTEIITWNADGSGFYSNANNPSSNTTW